MEEKHLYAFFPVEEIASAIYDKVQEWVEKNITHKNCTSYEKVSVEDDNFSCKLEVQVESEYEPANLSGQFGDATPEYYEVWWTGLNMESLTLFDPDGNNIEPTENYIKSIKDELH